MKNCRLPEVMALVIIAIQQSNQGVTFQDLREIYEFAVGRYPSDKTIYRIISRINEAVDPDGEPTIKSYRENGSRKVRYVFNQNNESYFHSMMVGRGLKTAI